jgi:hypothetical protein
LKEPKEMLGHKEQLVLKALPPQQEHKEQLVLKVL